MAATMVRPPRRGPRALRHVSLELAGEAARLAGEVGGAASAVLLGYGVEPLAEPLAQAGAAEVLLADAPELGQYTTEAYAWVLARAIRERQPWAVLLPATSFGRDLAPRVAARLGLGLTADCLGLELGREGALLQLKPAFGGQLRLSSAAPYPRWLPCAPACCPITPRIPREPRTSQASISPACPDRAVGG